MSALINDEGGRQRTPSPERDECGDAAMITSADASVGVRKPTLSVHAESVNVSNEDARFLIGSRGSTKAKVARVSGARIEINPLDSEFPEGAMRVEIFGDATTRARAKQYVEWVLRQRVGKITVDLSTPRDDVSVMDIPASCTAYVTGKSGHGLRRIEGESGALMFFGKPTTDPEDEPEKLIICGPRKSRRASELSVMSAVEKKQPGTYVDGEGKLAMKFEQVGDGLGDGWGFDVFPFADEREISFAIGPSGSTRRKIAAASGAILEYVGNLGIMAGDREERARCWDYVKWLMKKLKGTLQDYVSYEERSDVTVFHASSGKEMRDILGRSGDHLREIELRHGVYIINIPSHEQDKELLLIYSHSSQARADAKRALLDSISGGAARGEQRPNRCYDFSVGRCTRGDSCKWAHVMNGNDRGYRGGGPIRGRENQHRRDKPYSRAPPPRDEKPPVFVDPMWGSGARRGDNEYRDKSEINARLG